VQEKVFVIIRVEYVIGDEENTIEKIHLKEFAP